MHKIKNILLFALFTTITTISFAQRNVYPIDTIDLKTSRVVLYSDNTWQYLIDDESPMTRRDSIDLMKDNWDTQQIFGYLKERGQKISRRYDLSNLNKEAVTVPIAGTIYGGFRRGHDGVDVSLKKGDKVRAAFDGVVRYAQFNKHGYGNLVVIRHYNGLETWYGHLDRIYVQANQTVKSGEYIGAGGRTGRAYADHLHFETRYHDKPMDPQMIFDFSKSANPQEITQNDSESTEKIDNETINSSTKSTKKKSSKTDKTKKGSKSSNSVSAYTIKNGDTLSKIAVKNHTTVAEICKLNGIKKDAKLSLNKKLKVPKK